MYISKTSTQIFNKWYLRLSCWGEFGWVAMGGFHWPVVNKIPPPFVASSELRLLPCGFLCHKHPIFVWPFLHIPLLGSLTFLHLLGNWSLLARPFVNLSPQRPHTLPKFPWGPSNLLLNPLSLSGSISHGIE